MRLAKGYSLIELLVTLAIIAILSSVAYPAYTHHLKSTRRKQAETILLSIADDLESYRGEHGSYQGASISTLSVNTKQDPFYRFLIEHPSDQQYVIKAIPQQTQTGDDCGVLSINELGERKAVGPDTATCW